MKTVFILLISIFFSFYLSAQDGKISENIEKAKLSNGVEYSANGSVKVAVNVGMIEFFYTWSKTADTSNLVNIKGWNASGLSDFLNTYYSKGAGLNFEEELKKCRLIAEEIKQKNQERQQLDIASK